MKNRIIAALIGLSMAASVVLLAPLAMAAPAAVPGMVADGAQVILVGDRGRAHRDDRRDRRAHRDDRRDRRAHRDDRRRHDRRFDHRHDRRGHDRRRGHDHDDAPYILGGIALTTILLLQIFEHD